MSIIADCTSSIPHGIIFRSELSRVYDNFLFRLSCFSTSNRIRSVHVNTAVYRSHCNIKIHTVAHIHTSVLSIEGYQSKSLPALRACHMQKETRATRAAIMSCCAVGCTNRFNKTDYPIYSTSCLPT